MRASTFAARARREWASASRRCWVAAPGDRDPTVRAGTPATIEKGATTASSGTTVPAATTQESLMTTHFPTTAPGPMRTPVPTHAYEGDDQRSQWTYRVDDSAISDPNV